MRETERDTHLTDMAVNVQSKSGSGVAQVSLHGLHVVAILER